MSLSPWTRESGQPQGVAEMFGTGKAYRQTVNARQEKEKDSCMHYSRLGFSTVASL